MSPTPYDANEAIKERGGGGERERERERESLETEPRYLIHDIYSIRCKVKSKR